MALKTNCKVVKDRIRKLIVDREGLENYDIDTTGWTWMQIASKLWETAMSEQNWGKNERRSYQDRFVDWLSGLPTTFDAGWWWNESAVEILGDILEETEEERSKYSEADAERLLSYLVYRECEYAHRKEVM